jgi:hypothetical protein
MCFATNANAHIPEEAITVCQCAFDHTHLHPKRNTPTNTYTHECMRTNSRTGIEQARFIKRNQTAHHARAQAPGHPGGGCTRTCSLILLVGFLAFLLACNGQICSCREEYISAPYNNTPLGLAACACFQPYLYKLHFCCCVYLRDRHHCCGQELAKTSWLPSIADTATMWLPMARVISCKYHIYIYIYIYIYHTWHIHSFKLRGSMSFLSGESMNRDLHVIKLIILKYSCLDRYVLDVHKYVIDAYLHNLT